MISYALQILTHYIKLPALLLAMAACFACWRSSERAEREGRMLRRQRTALSILCAYLILALEMLVFARTEKVGRHFALNLFWSYRAIAEGRTYLLYLDIFNVLLFVPLGVLFPMAERKPGFWKSVGLGAALSLFAELLQALTARGLFELDDLFHNIIGTAIGVGLWLLVSHLRMRGGSEARQYERVVRRFFWDRRDRR